DIRASFPVILAQLKKTKSASEAAGVLENFTGWRPEEKKLVRFLPFLEGKGDALFDQMNSEVAALGQLMANRHGIGFTATTHISEYVQLLALGPRAHAFRVLIRNVDVSRNYSSLAGI